MSTNFFRSLGIKVIYLLLIIGPVLLSILPDIYHLRIAPAGTTYPILHNYVHDYYGYLSEMKDGYDGKWLVSYRGTSERNRPIFIYTFFIVLGKIGKIFSFSLPFTYFLARILFGSGVLFASLWLIKKIFKSDVDRLTALFLVAFSTGFWKFGEDSSIFAVKQYLEFWTHFDALTRITFLPHHLISQMLGIFSIGFTAEAILSRKIGSAILAGIFGIIASICFHGTMINLLIAWIIFVPIWFFFTKKMSIRNRLVSIFYLAIFGFMTGLALLYMLSLAYTVWPWTLNSNLAARLFFVFPLGEYIGVLGPTVLFTLIGLLKLIKSKEILPIFLLIWGLVPFLGIFILAHIFPQWSNQPYMEATSYVPFAILSVFGIQTISDKFKRYKDLIYLSLILVLAIYFVPPFATSFRRKLYSRNVSLYTDYLPRNQMDGFAWLDKNTQDSAVVLAGGYTAAPLIAYTHNSVVYMDDLTTYNGEVKKAEMLKFFSQSDVNESRNILQKYKVDYVFYSFDTDYPKDEFIKQLPLEKKFESGRVVIYSVVNDGK